MPLDKDNSSHRGFSNNLDAKYGGNPLYDKVARPVIHGTYHAGRYVGNGLNPEELARSKDQFCTFGTGQSQSDYLKAHREAEAARQAAEAAKQAAEAAAEAARKAAEANK